LASAYQEDTPASEWSLRQNILRDRLGASRVRSLRSPLRALDPPTAAPDYCIYRSDHRCHFSLYNNAIVWFFEKEGSFLRFETRDAEDGDGFELVASYPDGKQQIERFDDSALLLKRQAELESFYADDGWAGPFGRR
jgi:hypothetical protein